MIKFERTKIDNPFEFGFYAFIGAFLAWLCICAVGFALWFLSIICVMMFALAASVPVESKPKPKPKTVPAVMPAPVEAKPTPNATKSVRTLVKVNAEMKAVNIRMQNKDYSNGSQMTLVREKIKLQKELDTLNK